MVSMQEIQHLKFEISENYKYLHRHPELGFEEYETSRFILDKLAEYGIECRSVARTGVVATISGAHSGKTVGIRADIDALPLTEMADVEYKSENEGVMHACGHDSHIAMLLGAAKYFQDNKDKIKGNIRLIFQPAEEGAAPRALKAAVENGCSEKGGAASMIAFDVLEGVDACFALHIFPGIPNGKLFVHHDRAMASSDIFEAVIVGKGGHGSSPETAIDPVGALSEVIAAFNQFTAREISALEPCVLSIGTINTDSSWNIIPDKVVVTGGFRAFDNKIRDYTFSRLGEIATHICAAHRCTCDFKRTKGYDPTVNNTEISQKMVAVANEIFGEGGGTLVEKPAMGSEDVGYYFQKIPGAIGMLGTSIPNEPVVANHNPHFKVSLDALPYGVLFHINMAISYLNDN